MEHDDHVVYRNMDVCSRGSRTATGEREHAGEIPLSMPSAPSRMAASKLASVFSGKLAEACLCGACADAGQECEQERLDPRHTPRWPQHSGMAFDVSTMGMADMTA